MVQLVLDRRPGAELGLQVAQVQADRDELLLGAVMEVSLQASALVHRGRHDAGAGVLHLGELSANFDPESCDLDRQAGADEDRSPAAATGFRSPVDHDPQPEIAPAHGRLGGRVRRKLEHQVAVGVGVRVLVRKPEVQLQRVVRDGVGEGRSDRLRLDRPARRSARNVSIRAGPVPVG